MKLLYAIILSATFALTLHSCGDDAVSPNYQEYPGDLAVVGLRGPVKSYHFVIQRMKFDDLNEDGEFEELFFYFDTQGNLSKLIFNSAKVKNFGYMPILIYSLFYDEKSEIYEFSERDKRGRVTLRTTLDDSGNAVATTSYIYDDNKRKCSIEYKELTQGGEEKISSASLDEYGYYEGMFSIDFKNRDMLNSDLENRPLEKPTGNYDYDSYFEKNGYHYFVRPRCEYH